MKNIFIAIAVFLALFSSAYAQISCASNHQAWIWNCQTILDNWTLDDDTTYTINYPCLWSGLTPFATVACKLAVDDSCTVVLTMSPQSANAGVGGYTGAEIYSFVQNAMSQCQSNNLVSAHQNSLTQGVLCLCNNSDASHCY